MRDEDWKYTGVHPIARVAWSRAAVVPPEEIRAARAAVDPLLLHLAGGAALVFVNGRFAPELSASSRPAGLFVGPLSKAIAASAAVVERTTIEAESGPRSAFENLNDATCEDGALVHLTKGTCLLVPIDVVYVTIVSPGAPPPAVAPGRSSSPRPRRG